MILRKKIVIMFISVFLVIISAAVFVGLNRYKIAEVLLSMAIKEARKIDDDKIRLSELVSLYSRKRDYANALAACKELLKSNELSDELKSYYSFSAGELSNRLNDFSEANKYADELLLIDPAKGHLLKARIFMKNDKKLAIENLKLALQLDSKCNSLKKLKPMAVNLLKELNSEPIR